MIEPSAANAVTYFGQILIVVALPAIAARLLDIPHPRLRLAYWRAVLVLCLALPLFAFIAQPLVSSPGTPSTSLTSPISGTTAETANASGAPSREIPFGIVAMALLLAGIWIRGAWLAMGYARLQRIRRSAPLLALDNEMGRLHAEIAPHAEIRRLTAPGQPATFGFWRPVVLLPDSVAAMPAAERLAILCHELVHVWRRDWLWTVAEELLRTLFWFHPAMRYAIARVQATREEVVDADVIARTGARHEYMRALMVFAEHPELAPATSFIRRRQLKTRLQRIATEAHMSRSRLQVVASALCSVLVGAVAVAGAAMRYDVAAEQQPFDPVPLNAVEMQFSVPVPRAIVRMERPVYPPGAWRTGIGAEVSLVIHINEDGSVTPEGRPNWRISVPETTLPEAVQTFWAQESWREFLDSVDQAARQWQYVASGDEAIVAAQVTFHRPLPPLPERDGYVDALRNFGQTARVVRLFPGSMTRVGGSIRPPTKIVHVEPAYPELAIATRVQGVVILDVLIDLDGRVVATSTIRSIPLLDQAARNAVTQWRFEPPVVDGVPRQVWMTVTVSFALPGQ